jgi:drug/metabolite transporter (DMT)-like permease
MSHTPSKLLVSFALIFGIIAASTAAPLIKFAAEMSPLVITAGRLLGAALIYLLIGRDALSAWRSLDSRDRRNLFYAAPFLAGHFAFWIAGFQFTDLPSAVLLLAVEPLVGAIVGARVHGEKNTRAVYITIAVAVIGLLVITYDDLQMSWRHLFGDLLVVIGTLLIIGFFSFGKRLRPKISFTSYMTLTYGLAGMWALVFVVITDAPVLSYSAGSYGALLVLIVVTTCIGHALINYTLPYTRLFMVNAIVLAEPVLAISMAAAFLGQTITGSEVVGGTLVIVALFISLRDEGRRTETSPTSDRIAE